MFVDLPVRKQAFLGEKDIDFTQWTYWNCFKGVDPSFCQKIGNIFISVWFQTNEPWNYVWWSSKKKTSLFLYHTNIDFTQRPFWDFFKEVNPWFWPKIGNFIFASFWTKIIWYNGWWSSSKKTSPPRLSKYGFYIVVILYFLQGSTYDLGQKMEFSSLLVFKQNGPWNNVCWPSS